MVQSVGMSEAGSKEDGVGGNVTKQQKGMSSSLSSDQRENQPPDEDDLINIVPEIRKSDERR